jgi:hypothetical protein
MASKGRGQSEAEANAFTDIECQYAPAERGKFSQKARKAPPVMVDQKSVNNNVRSEKKARQTFLSVPDISLSFVLRREAVLREQMDRHLTQVPHDAEPGEDL